MSFKRCDSLIRHGTKLHEVPSKAVFYALYEAGLLGNKLRTFRSIEAYLAGSYRGPVTMRYRGAAGGVAPRFGVRREEVEEVASAFVKQGYARENIQLNESAPDGNVVLQGEVTRAEGWMMRFCRCRGLTMTAAMARAEHLVGPHVPLILQALMSPSSWADFEVLIEWFPDSVIEIGIYSSFLGELHGRNAITWEVRNY